MKRIGNLFNRIISYENLVRADKKARLGKTKRYGVKKFDRNPYENLVRLQKALIEDTYRTSEYCVYTIIADRGNKEREIYRLPYYPDRIVHHAIWQIFPVEARGIDFIGYVFYHDRILLRKDTKKKFIYKLSYKSKNKRLAAMAAYWGWCKYGNCHNLWYRFTRSYNFKDYRQKLLSDDRIKESTG